MRDCRIGATGEGVELLRVCPGIPVPNGTKERNGDPGVIVDDDAQVPKRFVEAMTQHRHWTRKGKNPLVVTPDGDEMRGKKLEI